MIAANELRIGNLVFWNRKSEGLPKQLVEVYNIMRSACRVYTFMELGEVRLELDNIDPIAITRDGLLKAGFINEYISQKEEKYVIKPNGHIPFVVFMEYPLGKYVIRNHEPGVFMTTIELNSIHQLQNIYFAATGEELGLTRY